MWGAFEKIEIIKNKAVYRYGYESHHCTGIIQCDLDGKNIEIVKSSGEDEAYAKAVFRMFYLVYKHGFKDSDMIAFG